MTRCDNGPMVDSGNLDNALAQVTVTKTSNVPRRPRAPRMVPKMMMCSSQASRGKTLMSNLMIQHRFHLR